jgi:hypothetical protein
MGGNMEFNNRLFYIDPLLVLSVVSAIILAVGGGRVGRFLLKNEIFFGGMKNNYYIWRNIYSIISTTAD